MVWKGQEGSVPRGRWPGLDKRWRKDDEGRIYILVAEPPGLTDRLDILRWRKAGSTDDAGALTGPQLWPH